MSIRVPKKNTREIFKWHETSKNAIIFVLGWGPQSRFSKVYTPIHARGEYIAKNAIFFGPYPPQKTKPLVNFGPKLRFLGPYPL